jgi:hypothetical protein
MAKFRASLQQHERQVTAQRSAEAVAAQQKAPGLATGGSAWNDGDED